MGQKPIPTLTRIHRKPIQHKPTHPLNRPRQNAPTRPHRPRIPLQRTTRLPRRLDILKQIHKHTQHTHQPNHQTPQMPKHQSGTKRPKLTQLPVKPGSNWHYTVQPAGTPTGAHPLIIGDKRPNDDNTTCGVVQQRFLLMCRGPKVGGSNPPSLGLHIARPLAATKGRA